SGRRVAPDRGADRRGAAAKVGADDLEGEAGIATGVVAFGSAGEQLVDVRRGHRGGGGGSEDLILGARAVVTASTSSWSPSKPARTGHRSSGVGRAGVGSSPSRYRAWRTSTCSRAWTTRAGSWRDAGARAAASPRSTLHSAGASPRSRSRLCGLSSPAPRSWS